MLRMPQFVYEVSAARAATSDATASSIVGHCIVSAPSERGGGDTMGEVLRREGTRCAPVETGEVLDDRCARAVPDNAQKCNLGATSCTPARRNNPQTTEGFPLLCARRSFAQRDQHAHCSACPGRSLQKRRAGAGREPSVAWFVCACACVRARANAFCTQILTPPHPTPPRGS